MSLLRFTIGAAALLLASTHATLPALARDARPNPAASEATQSRPNFLIILADDLGYSDIGAFGSEIATPNLDALAARGLKLTGLHSAPTCSPTRSMLLTGVDNHEAGLGTMAELIVPNQQGKAGYQGFLRPDTATLAERLGGGGYRTLFSGKWHLGLTPEQDPAKRGFQHSFALLQGEHNHFGLQLAVDPTKGYTYREDGKTLGSLPADFYSSDYFAAKLADQIRQTKAGSDGTKPFFAYLAFTAPHWPLQAPAETIARYRGRYDAGYDVLRDQRLKRQIELGLLDAKAVPHAAEVAPRWDTLTPEQKARESRRMEVYAAMVDRLDWNVGRVIAALRETGELDNTVILFLADNGAEGTALENQSIPGVGARYDAADNRLENIGAATSYDSVGPGWAEAASAPSWRFKGYQTEGGTRVVSFLSGRGIKPGIAGAYASVQDVAPTFLDLAGVKAEATLGGRKVTPIRGRSWVPLLNGKAQRVYPADRAVGGELFGGRALRQGDWKLLDRGDGQWRLFDVARDPGETTDLAAKEPARTAALVKAWDDYAREVGVVLPDPPLTLFAR